MGGSRTASDRPVFVVRSSSRTAALRREGTLRVTSSSGRCDVLRWRHRAAEVPRPPRALVRNREELGPVALDVDPPPTLRSAGRGAHFEATLFALEQALARSAALDKEMAAVAESAPYRTPVGWLRCFRGIDTLSAMILMAEIFYQSAVNRDLEHHPGPGVEHPEEPREHSQASEHPRRVSSAHSYQPSFGDSVIGYAAARSSLVCDGPAMAVCPS